jgi:uncharacterized protein YjbJ (UPF0337 family)
VKEPSGARFRKSLVRNIPGPQPERRSIVSNWDKVEGEGKEKVGELTDDESLEKEGKAQGALGDVKEKADEGKEKVEEAAEKVEDEIRDKL